MRILLLGANGFIGSNLTPYILNHRDWEIIATDLYTDKLGESLHHPRFHFTQGDIRKNKEWVERRVAECDVVLPLVAIANPAIYVKNPLAVFELDFEANLEIVRHCVTYKKRIIFPSTSEVYGMSADTPYDEETSALTVGPISKERWIYSCSKQMMDRVIWAYGKHHDLPFTLFRPFNWFGPGLDNVLDPKGGSSRVVSQFLGNIFHKRDIVLVGGGAQKRCFLYIDDGIEALVRIIDNRDGCAAGRIFNIGHPGNECSIAELAEMMLEIASGFKGYESIRSQISIRIEKGEEYYGAGYQDIVSRVPKIDNAKTILGWKPTTDMQSAVRKTIEYYMAKGRRLNAMEELDISLDEQHEAIHRHAEHSSERWLLYCALISALMAVAAAITGLYSSHDANEAMLEQMQASDLWGYYQAKGMKAMMTELRGELVKPPPADIAPTIARYRKEQQDIKEKADDKAAAAALYMRRHEQWSRAVTAFQIAIAVTAMSAISRRKRFLWLTLALAVAGAGFSIAALLVL